MWKCGKCGEEHEGSLNSCWKCGAPKTNPTASSFSSPNQTSNDPPASKPTVKRPQTGLVLKHWYSLVPDFKTSTHQFYSDIEQELQSRNVPGLDTARVVFAQGGPLSAKREYLRMTRETLVFDVCSAPFGTGHFFSCRFVDIRKPITIPQIIAVFIAFLCLLPLLFWITGIPGGIFLIVVGLLCSLVLMRMAAQSCGGDLDAWLLKVPIFGGIYERFIRKETYHREDTRLMYIDTINDVVKSKVEELLGTNGIKFVSFKNQKSILDDLYREGLVDTETGKPEPAS